MHRSEQTLPLKPLSSIPVPRLGIVGGGQLAKMTASAAATFGCEVVVLERQEEFPAHSLDTHAIIGDWDDPAVLMSLATHVDVITLENEFVKADSLAVLHDQRCQLYPSARALKLVQDKFVQKQLCSREGVPVTRYVDCPTLDSARHFGFPLVLKKRCYSYDGKGNATARNDEELHNAWKRLNGDRESLYAERFCSFEREMATIVTRAQDGSVVYYPVVETINREHICHVVIAPARITEEVAAKVRDCALRVVSAIDYVGSLGLEFFLLDNGEVVLNEIAPRVHNTGHYTIEACACSQFENHVRAILGWPLGSAQMVAPAAAMVNLLGFAEGSGTPHGLIEALAVTSAHIHVYGKAKSARGRKMGHVTVLGQTTDEAVSLAQRTADLIRFGGDL